MADKNHYVSRIEWVFSNLNYAYVQNFYGFKHCSRSLLGKKQNYEANADWNQIKYRAQIFTIKLISSPFGEQCNYVIFTM